MTLDTERRKDIRKRPPSLVYVELQFAFTQKGLPDCSSESLRVSQVQWKGQLGLLVRGEHANVQRRVTEHTSIESTVLERERATFVTDSAAISVHSMTNPPAPNVR